MIKADELMVGNLIKIDNVVTKIDERTIFDFNHDNRLKEAIKPTEEWLFKTRIQSNIMCKIEINVPNAVSGFWKVETFTVTKDNASQKWLQLQGKRFCPPGTYKKLVKYEHYADVTVMSNTPDEIRDCLPFVDKAYGRILVNGLGLGVLLVALLEKENITKITVIEKSEDVIKLVSPSITDERVEIIHADAFEYKPSKDEQFECVWHDIWDYIDAENLPEMHKLHRKYGRRAIYQESWCRKECERQRKNLHT